MGAQRQPRVTIEAEADAAVLTDLVNALQVEKPPLATITRLTVSELPVTGARAFVILESCSDLPNRCAGTGRRSGMQRLSG